MDPLSVTASIIAVLQLTGEVIKYLNDVKDAPKECQQCTYEISNIQSLLISLRYHTSQGSGYEAWFTAVQGLNTVDGPLDQYMKALELLRSKVEIRSGAQSVKLRLLWKFTKAEIASVLARIERLKSLIAIALELDHFKLSQAIKADLQILQDTSRAVRDDTNFLRGAIPYMHSDVLAIRQTQDLQWDAQQLQKHQTIIEWLSPTDFPSQQHDIISRKQQGTGQWFLRSPEFVGWLQGPDKTLFCPGIPGAGKTMMAAIAIDHLCRTAQGDVGVAYIFCNYKVQVGDGAPSLIAAILKQLVQSRPDIASSVYNLYDHHSKRKTRPSEDEIINTLQSVCQSYRRIYFVVDALDECNQREVRNQLIDTLRELQSRGDVRLLFTSRLVPDVTDQFRLDAALEVSASTDDVSRFVGGQIPRLPRCIQRDDELKLAVCEKIAESVDGMFLLARLHVDSLLDKRTRQDVLSTLGKLSKGSAALEKAYGDAIARINGQLPGDLSLARHVISWTTYAQRPLTTDELRYALAIQPNDKELNEAGLYYIEDIVSVCAGLVTVDEMSNIVRIVHYTAQDYFERIRSEWLPDAEEELAVACLTFLSFDSYPSAASSSQHGTGPGKGPNIIDYMPEYWAEHVRPVEVAVSDLALGFLRNDSLIPRVTNRLFSKAYGRTRQKMEPGGKFIGLHLSAAHGLLHTLQKLLESENWSTVRKPDMKDENGRTPLSWGAGEGHASIVEVLVQKYGCDINSKDQDGRTPLWYAAQNGRKDLVDILLKQHNIAVNTQDDQYERTPLCSAAYNGHEEIVQMLCDHEKVDINLGDRNYRTPLSFAAGNGHLPVLRILLEQAKIQADRKDILGQSPFFHAAWNGKTEALKLLLERKDIDFNTKDSHGRTALYAATWLNHGSAVRLLIGFDAINPNIQDKYGWTALSKAVQNNNADNVLLILGRHDTDVNLRDALGQPTLAQAALAGSKPIVEILVHCEGIKLDDKDEDGRTPLWLATEKNHGRVIRFLLGLAGVDANATDLYSRTPLLIAAERGHVSAIQSLLAHSGVKADQQDDSRWTALSRAAFAGSREAVQLLVENHRVNANSKNNEGQTPLSLASKRGYSKVVEFLLGREEVDADSKDNTGRTPLSWAAGEGYKYVVALLVRRKDVDVDSEDDNGWTPRRWAESGKYHVILQILDGEDVPLPGLRTHVPV